MSDERPATTSSSISVLPAPASAQQADRDSVQQAAPAARVDLARDALSSVVKYAVSAQRKTWLSTIKSLVLFAFSSPSAARLFPAEFPETVQRISVTSPKQSSGHGTSLFCRLPLITP